MTSPDKGLTRGARFGIFVNVVLICLLGLALALTVVFGVKRLSYRTELRIDLTEEGSYELDPLTQELVGSVAAPLKVTAVIGYDRGHLERVKDAQGRPRGDLLAQHYRPILLHLAGRIAAAVREWEARSPHIKASVLLADTQADAVEALARRLGRAGPDDVLNRVIFEHGGRTLEIQAGRMIPDVYWGAFPAIPGQPADPPRRPRTYRVHEELTAALRSVLMGERRRIGILTGVEGVIESANDNPAWGQLRAMMAREGFEIVAWPNGSREVPTALDALLLAAPKAQLEPATLAAIESYEAQRGGRIFLALDPLRNAQFQSLLEPYGVQLTEKLLADAVLSHGRTEGPWILDNTEMWSGGHPVVAAFGGKGIRLRLGATAPLELTRDRAAGVSAAAILRGSRHGRLLDLPENADREAIQRALNLAKPLGTPPTLGAALTRPMGVGGEEARVLVFPSRELLRVDALEHVAIYGNRDLLLNGLRWLTDVETGIGMLPRERLKSRVIDPRKLEGPFAALAVFGLPSFAFALGLVIFFLRRR